MTPRTKLALAAVPVALTMAAAAHAAAKPWQWTTAQARSAVVAQGDELYVTPEGLSKSLVSVACRGTGKRTSGRFTAFRCPATFEPTSPGDPLNRAVLLARTRRAGGLCWTTGSVVPSGCLAPGKRARGSVRDAYRAMVRRVGTLNHSFHCVANGAGFYSCSWMTADVVHRGTVTFGAGGAVVARELS